MKKKYGKPESKFVVFDVRDIVVTSGPVPGPEVSAEDPGSEDFDEIVQ